jgi:UDP-N-acetylglucosamine--N-acetylmuramyl-(pentapeptide) pyrophosphoryl-undecaprenol N-acetylglucosamine transferase
MIAAGGTGGHIYPGIAVAQEIRRRDASSQVQFVGTARGLETRLVPQAGFELSLIESAGLKNVSLGARMRGVALLPRSFNSARKLMRQFQPDVVVGAGGYVSGPVVLTAALTNRPTLVMESNALPGWTNRMLARFVDRAAVSFEQALPYFRGKAKVTGNPVRREFFEIPAKRREPGKFSLLVFGGSQGARAINEAMIVALPKLKELPVELRIEHQTGAADFEKVKAAYEAAGWGERADVRSYIDNMMADFAEADLVLCRAGASTTAELIAAG